MKKLQNLTAKNGGKGCQKNVCLDFYIQIFKLWLGALIPRSISRSVCLSVCWTVGPSRSNEIHHNQLGSINIHCDPSGCIGIYLDPFGIFWIILIHLNLSGIHWDALGSIRIYLHSNRYSGSNGIHQDPKESNGIHQDPLESIKTHQVPSGSIKIHQDPTGFLGMHPSGSIRVHQYSK